MTQIQLLFILTFVFGTLRLLTCINLFTIILKHPSELFIPEIDEYDHKDHWLGTLIKSIGNSIHWLSTLFFYFSLCYQVWFWFIHICKII